MTTNKYPGIGYKTQGLDFNFYQKLSVTATTFGGSSVDGYQPDMIIWFPTQGVQFLNLGTGVIEYSFNGSTIHGELNSANATAGLTFDNRVVSMIWFRVQTGSTGPILISVQAWATR
jgi:hypothetical protein